MVDIPKVCTWSSVIAFSLWANYQLFRALAWICTGVAGWF